jgi:hypothetical protein
MGVDDIPTVFSPMTLPTQYMDLPADTHNFSLVPDGKELVFAFFDEQEFTLEAGHSYLLAILGNVSADDLHFTLIDETEALEQMDISFSAVTIHINNLYGIEAMDATLNDDPIYSNLLYGDYFVGQDPLEGQGSKIMVHDDPDTVIFEYADATGSPANVFAVFAFSGTFPGTMFEDFVPFYVGQYAGEMTIIDGGSIAVNDAATISFDDIGQRVQFTLTLDETTTLDILQAATDVTSGADAYLRIYNASGDVIVENDELSRDNTDAGTLALELDAGIYILEAATFVDLGVGEFTLTVSESQ